MKQPVTVGYSDYTLEEQDVSILRNVILPKLKQGKSVNVFCSFSYFTPNYTGIFLMHELSNLVRQGCTAYIVMWDINCEVHPYFETLLKQEGATASKIIETKMQEILELHHSFKTPMARLHLYRASDVLNRFIHKRNPNLFIKFFGAMERLDLNNLLHKHKASHLIQMPLDIFFAHFFQDLYPEDINDRVELILSYNYQDTIYAEVQKAMRLRGIFKDLHPISLLLPQYPYLFHDGKLPEWNMSKDAMIEHILNVKPTQENIKQVYDVMLKKFLNVFELLDNDGTVQQLDFDAFLKKHETTSLENQQVSLAYNLYNHLAALKRKIQPVTAAKTIHPNSADTVKYAKLLSKPRILDILHRSDGTKNSTQLAKELKMARSNFSTYLNTLKKEDLIMIDEEGRVHRKIAAIKANFEAGIN